jgi:hypothetical protein
MSEGNGITQDEQNKMLFVQLVVMLTTSAMQQMGKLVNPATGKTEVHLDAAEASIDFLEMLRVKTTGNLDQQEERVLADSLHSLRMNYWETRQAHGGTEAQAAQEPTSASSAEDDGKKPDESKEPKFHKKYE